MLENVPAAVGLALRPVRAGTGGLAVNDPRFEDAPRSLTVRLPALLPDGAMAARHTADGDGTSPAVYWDAVPPATQSIVLLVEDADGPSRRPLMHVAAWDIAPESGGVGVDALAPAQAGRDSPLPMARNSFGRVGWTPIDPPTGHGTHRYAFQLFAVGAPLRLEPGATRSAVMDAMLGRVLATGCAIATYERPAERGSVARTVLAVAVGGAALAAAGAMRRRSARRTVSVAPAAPVPPGQAPTVPVGAGPMPTTPAPRDRPPVETPSDVEPGNSAPPVETPGGAAPDDSAPQEERLRDLH